MPNMNWFSIDGLFTGSLESVHDDANLPNGVRYGTIVKGESPYLGTGEFIFLKGAANMLQGNFVEYNGYTGAVNRTISANAGNPIAVAIADVVENKAGWYQIQGNAIASVGAPSDGADLYFNTAGAAQTSAAAGKQILGAICSSAGSITISPELTALTSTQAVVSLNHAHMQGQVT